MPTDVYNMTSNSTSTSTVTAQEMIMNVSGGSMEGCLIQGVSFSYSQNIQTIREFGSTNYYYSAQPPSGQLNISRLVAKNKSIIDMFPLDSASGESMWHPPANEGSCPDIELSSIDKKNLTKYTLKQCIITNIGITTSADNPFVQESLSIIFMGLTIE